MRSSMCLPVNERKQKLSTNMKIIDIVIFMGLPENEAEMRKYEKPG